MCCRYFVSSVLPQEFEPLMMELNRGDGVRLPCEMFPSDLAPVLAYSRQMVMRPFLMRWGYSGSRLIINARSETASQKPLFREGMQKRRCLIPASHYFEWAAEGKRKVKYALKPAGSDGFYMAGIYHLEQHGSQITPAFTILTRDAREEIAFIHPRMPVILGKAWLNLSLPADELLHAAQDTETFMEFAGLS